MEGSEQEVYSINADGTGWETNLTNSPGGAGQPSYSSDGTKIAFMSSRDDFVPWRALNPEIYVMNANGTNQVRLTHTASPIIDAAPDWGPAIAVVDSDGDGVPGAEDAFPNDPTESADSDGDGLGDNGDPDTVGDAVEALEDAAFGAPGERQATLSRLDGVEAAIVSGDRAEAQRMLVNLRRRLDGCESGPTPDRNDWIVDCAAQDEIRRLLDRLLSSLD